MRKRVPDTPSLSEEEVAANLSLLQANYDVFHASLSSTRRVVGPFITLAKKLLRQLLSNTLVKQTMYNAASAKLVAHLARLGGGRGGGRGGAVYVGNNRVLTWNAFGHKMLLPADDVSITPHLILDGYWEIWITEFFLSLVNEGDTVIDVGANVGYYTLLAASKVGPRGKVYAFDPSPTVFDLLFRNVELNGFLDRCMVVNAAATDKKGTAPFRKWKFHHGSSGFHVSRETLEKYRDTYDEIDVTTTSLDEFFESRGGRVDVVKIDAEASEPLVIQGMRGLLTRNPSVKVLLEWHPANRQAVVDLAGMGFQVYRINEDSSISLVTASDLERTECCMLYAVKES